MKVLNLHSFNTEASNEGVALQDTNEMNLSKKERAFIFIATYQRQHEGAEPSLEEIMEVIECSQGSASNYRAEYRQQIQATETRALVGAANGYYQV